MTALYDWLLRLYCRQGKLMRLFITLCVGIRVLGAGVTMIELVGPHWAAGPMIFGLALMVGWFFIDMRDLEDQLDPPRWMRDR